MYLTVLLNVDQAKRYRGVNDSIVVLRALLSNPPVELDFLNLQEGTGEGAELLAAKIGCLPNVSTLTLKFEWKRL